VGLAAVFLAVKIKGYAGIFGCEASLFSFRAQHLVRRSGHHANLIARQDFRGIRKIASSGGPCFTEGSRILQDFCPSAALGECIPLMIISSFVQGTQRQLYRETQFPAAAPF
jgi:hypothetical protein